MEQNTEEKHQVTEKVKSGAYYREAMQWYNSRFVRPQTELAQMMVFAVISVTLAITALVAVTKLFPLSENKPIIMTVDAGPDRRLAINKIMGERETPSAGYAKFILAEYVKAREGYRDNKTKANINFVLASSSESLDLDYMMEIDPNNPASPEVSIGKTGSIIININPADVRLTQFTDNKPPIAAEQTGRGTVIYYKTTTRSGVQNSEYRKANISFTYKEIIIDQTTHEINQLPSIIITDYKTSAL